MIAKRPHPSNPKHLIASPRRRQLIEKALLTPHDVVLAAPPGYGKSTLARVLIGQDPSLQVLEAGDNRGFRPSKRRRRVICTRVELQPDYSDALVIGPSDLGFDATEVREAFGHHLPSPDILRQVESLARGWPIAILLLAKLAREETLVHALQDFNGSYYDSLIDYLDRRVLARATRPQRRKLIQDSALGPSLDARTEVLALSDIPLVQRLLRRSYADECIAICSAAAHKYLLAENYISAAQLFALADMPAHAALSLESLDSFNEKGLSVGATIPLEQLAKTPRLRQALNTTPPSTAQRPNQIIKVSLVSATVHCGEDDIALSDREVAFLFSLAAQPSHTASIATLSRLIGRSSSDAKLANLKVTANRVRRRLGSADAIISVPRGYALSGCVEVDVSQIDRLLGEISDTDMPKPVRELMWETMKLIDMKRPPRYLNATWFGVVESRVRSVLGRMLRTLAVEALEQRRSNELSEISSAMQQLNPCDEFGCELKLRGLLLRGEFARAREELDLFARRLAEESGKKPSATLTRLAAASRGP